MESRYYKISNTHFDRYIGRRGCTVSTSLKTNHHKPLKSDIFGEKEIGIINVGGSGSVHRLNGEIKYNLDLRSLCTLEKKMWM